MTPIRARSASGRSRRATETACLGLAVLVVWMLTSQSTARAANPACPLAASSTVLSCTYTGTGGEQTYDVPSGINLVTISATGSHGGHGNNLAAGGLGAVVSATITIPAGTTTLYVEVGSPGASDHGNAPGGFNGGGNSVFGGGGGGASDVRTCSLAVCTDLATDDTRLVVAGGGGGGGASGSNCGVTGGQAGDAAVSGAGNGGAGDTCTGRGGNGGFGGTGSATGSSSRAGGGGGGGYVGGGGGRQWHDRWGRWRRRFELLDRGSDPDLDERGHDREQPGRDHPDRAHVDQRLVLGRSIGDRRGGHHTPPCPRSPTPGPSPSATREIDLGLQRTAG